MELEIRKCRDSVVGRKLSVSPNNKGIATEAAFAVIDYLFRVVGFDRISSAHDARNIASGRVMQKIGMTHEGTFRRFYYQKDGSIGDRECYAILKSEWDKSR